MPETLLQEVNRLIEQVGERRLMRELSLHRTTIMRWRRGKVTVPPAQLRALRAMAYDVGVDTDWEGWRFHNGKLWSPSGIYYTPGELESLVYVYGERDALRAEVAQLRAQIAALSVDPHVRGDSANDAAITGVESPHRAA